MRHVLDPRRERAPVHVLADPAQAYVLLLHGVASEVAPLVDICGLLTEVKDLWVNHTTTSRV